MKKSTLIATTILMCGCGSMSHDTNSSLATADQKLVPAKPVVSHPQVNASEMSSKVSIDSQADKFKAAQKNVQTNPRNFSAYVDLGGFYGRMDRHAQAADSYENALLIKSNDLNVKANLAAEYAQSGKYNEALDIYKTLVTIHSEPWKIKNDMANVYRRKKEYNSAMKLVQEILIQQKNNIDAINTLALIYYDQQKYELSELTLQKAIKAKVDNAITHANLGLDLQKTDAETAAIGEFKKAAEMDQNFIEPRMTLAQMYTENGNYNEAKQLYFEVLETNPILLTARLNLGVVLMSSKNISESEQMLLSVLQIDPFNGGAAYNLGLLYQYYMQDGEKAVQYYDRFVGMSKSLPKTHPVFANIALAKKMPPKNPPAPPVVPVTPAVKTTAPLPPGKKVVPQTTGVKK